MTLEFFQIYYDDIQKEELYPFAQPFKNYGLTPFFENAVIADLVPACTADLVSVCSWRLKQKRNSSSSPIILKGDTSLTEEKILNADFDVAILTPKSSSHQMLNMARNWHGSNWDKGFQGMKMFLFRELNTRVPEELKHPIYENHFIAKREIYQDYVNNFLIPMMTFMQDEIYVMGDKSDFLLPSGYAKRKRANPEEVGRIKTLLGFEDWPLLPFLLERLFSIYINDKGFNVIKL
jgi:hypothetical protein